MNLKDVNSFLWSLFLISLTVAMAAVITGFMRSNLGPYESLALGITKEVPLTRGNKFPSPEGPFPGQMHVTLDKVGKLDCVWIFKPEGNDWLAIGGPGCPEEVVK